MESRVQYSLIKSSWDSISFVRSMIRILDDVYMNSNVSSREDPYMGLNFWYRSFNWCKYFAWRSSMSCLDGIGVFCTGIGSPTVKLRTMTKQMYKKTAHACHTYLQQWLEPWREVALSHTLWQWELVWSSDALVESCRTTYFHSTTPWLCGSHWTKMLVASQLWFRKGKM